MSDLTFVGDQGWALDDADARLAHSVDDGRSWQPMSVRAPNGVTSIRFATDRIGYTFSRTELFMTTDGGASWQRQPGGADALEPLNGNVIRLVADDYGVVRVETAGLGSATWKAQLSDSSTANVWSVALTRTAQKAFVIRTNGEAGSLYRVSLYVSSDDGRTWTRRPDPCRSTGAARAGVPLAANAVTTAADGSVSLLCATGGGSRIEQLILMSTDGGRVFIAGSTFALGTSGVVSELATPTSTVALVSAGDGVYRSVDAGRSWRLVIRDPTNGGGQCAFESMRVGHCVSNDRRTIWTTTDAGLTWTSARVG